MAELLSGEVVQGGAHRRTGSVSCTQMPFDLGMRHIMPRIIPKKEGTPEEAP